MSDGKKIGEVTHYFPKVKAAVVKFTAPAKVGDKIVVRGKRGTAHEKCEVEQTIDSLQLDRVPVESAKKGDELGMGVSEEVREGDEIYAV